MSRMWSNNATLTGGYPAKGHPGYVRNSSSSKAAADSIRDKSESLEDVVRSLLRGAGEEGLTDFELQAKAEREGITSLLSLTTRHRAPQQPAPPRRVCRRAFVRSAPYANPPSASSR